MCQSSLRECTYLREQYQSPLGASKFMLFRHRHGEGAGLRHVSRPIPTVRTAHLGAYTGVQSARPNALLRPGKTRAQEEGRTGILAAHDHPLPTPGGNADSISYGTSLPCRHRMASHQGAPVSGSMGAITLSLYNAEGKVPAVIRRLARAAIHLSGSGDSAALSTHLSPHMDTVTCTGWFPRCKALRTQPP